MAHVIVVAILFWLAKPCFDANRNKFQANHFFF